MEKPSLKSFARKVGGAMKIVTHKKRLLGLFLMLMWQGAFSVLAAPLSPAKHCKMGSQNPQMFNIHRLDASPLDVRVLEVGDFDNDKNIDILAADNGGTQIALLKNKNGLAFQNSWQLNFSPRKITRISAVDFDGDGWLDFAVGFYGAGFEIYKNNKNLSFTKSWCYKGSNKDMNYRIGGLDWADVNLDGKLDLLVTDYGDVDGDPSVFKNNIRGGYSIFINNFYEHMSYSNCDNKSFIKSSSYVNSPGPKGRLKERPISGVHAFLDGKFGDFDLDGAMDIFLVSGWYKPMIFRNRIGLDGDLVFQGTFPESEGFEVGEGSSISLSDKNGASIAMGMRGYQYVNDFSLVSAIVTRTLEPDFRDPQNTFLKKSNLRYAFKINKLPTPSEMEFVNKTLQPTIGKDTYQPDAFIKDLDHPIPTSFSDLFGDDELELVFTTSNPVYQDPVSNDEINFLKLYLNDDLFLGDGVGVMTKQQYENDFSTPAYLCQHRNHVRDMKLADIDGDGDLDILEVNESTFQTSDGNGGIFIYQNTAGPLSSPPTSIGLTLDYLPSSSDKFLPNVKLTWGDFDKKTYTFDILVSRLGGQISAPPVNWGTAGRTMPRNDANDLQYYNYNLRLAPGSYQIAVRPVNRRFQRGPVSNPVFVTIAPEDKSPGITVVRDINYDTDARLSFNDTQEINGIDHLSAYWEIQDNDLIAPNIQYRFQLLEEANGVTPAHPVSKFKFTGSRRGYIGESDLLQPLLYGHRYFFEVKAINTSPFIKDITKIYSVTDRSDGFTYTSPFACTLAERLNKCNMKITAFRGDIPQPILPFLGPNAKPGKIAARVASDFMASPRNNLSTFKNNTAAPGDIVTLSPQLTVSFQDIPWESIQAKLINKTPGDCLIGIPVNNVLGSIAYTPPSFSSASNKIAGPKEFLEANVSDTCSASELKFDVQITAVAASQGHEIFNFQSTYSIPLNSQAEPIIEHWFVANPVYTMGTPVNFFLTLSNPVNKGDLKVKIMNPSGGLLTTLDGALFLNEGTSTSEMNLQWAPTVTNAYTSGRYTARIEFTKPTGKTVKDAFFILAN